MRNSITVYDSAHIWHVDEGIDGTEGGRGFVERGKWRRAVCGYFFQPKRRMKGWQPCKRCLELLEKNWLGSRRTGRRIIEVDTLPKRPRLPQQLTEQRFDPPEGMPR